MSRHSESVLVTLPGEGRQILASTGDNLLQVLQGAGHSIPSPCGGQGTCRKCRVLADGEPVLACQVTLTGDLSVELPHRERGFSILEEYRPPSQDHRPAGLSAGDEIRLAVDIGTTTVALQAIHVASSCVIGSVSFLNGQRRYGADVISRIHAAQGALPQLAQEIRAGLAQGIRRLAERCAIPPGSMTRAYIAGNTTMVYLVLGLPCESLGALPFRPAFPLEDRYDLDELLGQDAVGIVASFFPWISAFVGGDVTAGLLYSHSLSGRRFLLLDIGTNGEMALFLNGEVLCASTAAGPAFEGGNIAWGTGSVDGAICKVRLQGEKFLCDTIGGLPPVGICGSGVLDAAACLLKAGLMEESGLLDDSLFDEGVLLALTATGEQIRLYQRDIRELQLAKSAIRAGVEVLLDEAGVSVEDLDCVYLAGGFGHTLNLESALAIGLLPRSVRDKVRTCGNSALGGAALACADPGKLREARDLAARAREVNLASHARFQQLFVEYMSF